MMPAEESHEFPKPDGDAIADAVRRGLPASARDRTTLGVHGLVLFVFHGSSVTLLLPKQGIEGRSHAPFAKAFGRSARVLPPLEGAHWRVRTPGRSSKSRTVAKKTRHNTDHPLAPVERILDMAHVLGDARLPPLRRLVEQGLLAGSITLTGVEVSAFLPYAQFGWIFLWQVGAVEVLCTDTALLTFRHPGVLSLSGVDYTSGESRELGTTAQERFVFIGNLDTASFSGTPSLRLDETVGYARLYGPAAAKKAKIPVAAKTFLGIDPRGAEVVAGNSSLESLRSTLLSSSSSGECNLAADYYVSWDASF